jgi:tetratricopeptide (TPR) repeat protein
MTQSYVYHKDCLRSTLELLCGVKSCVIGGARVVQLSARVASALLGLLIVTLSIHAQAQTPDKPSSETDRDAVIRAAEEANNEGRFQDAVRLYSRAEKEFQADAALYRGRGTAHEMLNEDRKAVEDFITAIRKDSADYQAMEGLAGIYERGGKHMAEAIELYRRAAKLDPRPEWKDKLTTWIAMLESRSRPEEGSSVGCWHVGNEKAHKRDAEAAEAWYTKALDLNPRMFQAYYSRGLLRLRNGDAAAALADFEQTVHICPEFAQGFLYRGVAYERLGKPKEAREDVDRALTLDPRDPAVVYHLARMSEEGTDAEAVLKLYETALKLRPSPELATLIRERMAGLRGQVGIRKKDSSAAKDAKPLW